MGYNTDAIHEYQQTIKELHGNIDRIGKENRRLTKEYHMVDDAASYWKSNFEELHNLIVRILNTHGDDFTDGECIDAIHALLQTYQGESDELTEL